MKRILALLLVFLMIAAVAVGCGSKTAEQNTTNPSSQTEQKPNTEAGAKTDSKTEAKADSTPKGDTITIGTNNTITSLDPLGQGSNIGRSLYTVVMETLVETDHEGNFTPLLATSWESEGNTWTFHLRNDVTFSDGSPFTSKDVVATLQRVIDDHSLSVYSQFWSYLQSVEAVDDYTVNITTSAPYYALLFSVAFTPIMSAKDLEKYGENYWNEQHMLGTGPWVWKEWVDGAYVSFTKNENYWNKANYDQTAKNLYLRFLTEIPTAIAAHISGDLDAYIVNGGIGPELLPLYDNYKDKIEIQTIDTSAFVYIGYRCAGESAFADQNARLAVDYAINRQLICDTIFSGYASVPNSVVMPMVPGYDPDLPNYEYNPEKAREYLAKSNYDGHEIKLYCPTNTAKSEEQGLAIAEMLNDVGFNVKVEVCELAVLTQLRKEANYEMFIVNDSALGGTLAKYFSLKVYTDAHKSGYDDQKMHDLAGAILSEMDPQKNQELVKEFAHLSREVAAPHSILYYFRQANAINYSLKNMIVFPDGAISFKYIDWK